MLANTAARLLASRQLTVGLMMRATEIVDANYLRQTGAWTVDGTRTFTEVTFGPFAGPVEFDRAVLFDGDEPQEAIVLEEPLRLAAGMSYHYRATVRCS